MRETLPAWLDAAAERDRPEAGARFVDRREQETWHPWPVVAERAARVAGALRALGVHPGDRVAIVLPTHPRFLDTFLGAQLAGAVPTPLYPPVRLGRLDEYVDRTVALLGAAEARVVVTEPRIRRMLGRVVERAKPALGLVDAEDLLDGAPLRAAVDPDDLGLVQFSSGTTVRPKPVGLTHRQLIANASRILDAVLASNPLESDTPASGVSWLPLYHDMGLIGCILPAIGAPGPITLLPPEAFLAKPALWLRAISRHRGTISPAPDFAYALCSERIRDEELDGVDLSSWHMALDGAEPVSARTLRRFAERFGRWGFDASALMPVYGLSEAALAVTFTPTGRGVRSQRFDAEALGRGEAVDTDDGPELTSSGVPLPDFGVRIVGPDGEALSERRIGRIHARGPSVMQGYLDRDEQPFVDGWLDTGDLGFLLDGELFVTGRAKDLIVHRGANHAPHDLERAADAVEGVRTGCVAAVGRVGADGEEVLVFAEAREAVEGLADAVERAVRAGTGVGPDLVVVLTPGTLPRTSSGKIRRGETLRRWEAGELTPPRDVTPLMLAGALADSFLGHLRARWGRS